MNTKDYIKEDREFLHAIATPLMVASGQLEFVRIKNFEMPKAEREEHISKTEMALKKVFDLLQERRTEVKTVIKKLEEN